jgi:lipooligosaccharide transport system permease protein
MTSAVATPGDHHQSATRLAAIGALVWREWQVFRRIWRAPTFGSVLEPLWYLVVFGFGFGALVTTVSGIPYLDFMATGAAANAILFTGLFSGAINGYFRRTTEHVYDGFLSTSAGVPEIVTGESAWTAVRAAGVTITTLVTAGLFGVDLGWTALWAPLVGLVAGFGFACLGTALGARLRSEHQFDVVIAGVFAPMFVMSATFFPLDDAPRWLQLAGQVSPLTHVVALLRAAALGGSSDVALATHALVVIAFVAIAWGLAVWSLRAAVVR